MINEEEMRLIEVKANMALDRTIGLERRLEQEKEFRAIDRKKIDELEDSFKDLYHRENKHFSEGCQAMHSLQKKTHELDEYCERLDRLEKVLLSCCDVNKKLQDKVDTLEKYVKEILGADMRMAVAWRRVDEFEMTSKNVEKKFPYEFIFSKDEHDDELSILKVFNGDNKIFCISFPCKITKVRSWIITDVMKKAIDRINKDSE